MAKHPRVYPPEFRHKILELVRLGRSVNSVAREFEMDADSGRRDDILNSSERAELARLAAASFAREADTIPKRSSDS